MSGSVAADMGEPALPGSTEPEAEFAPNTHVIAHGGRVLALVEGGFRPYEMDADLRTCGPSDFGGTLERGYTAHPKLDPLTGELHGVSYFWGWGNRIQYTVIDPRGTVCRSVDVEVQGSPMMHDFGLTSDHVVLLDLPVQFNLELAAGGNPFPYRWDPAYQAHVGLLPRAATDGSAVRWFDIDPCYVFHPLNAFEGGGQVVIDVVRHPRMFDTSLLGPNEGPTRLRALAARPGDRRCDPESPRRSPAGASRIDDRYIGGQHPVGYSVGFELDGEANDTVLRHDFEDGTTMSRSLGPGLHVGEFLAVSHPGEAERSEGVLLGIVYDRLGARAISPSSTRGRLKPSVRSICRRGCPMASMEAGFPTQCSQARRCE